eukprot:7418791-Pyramimonas_sp.AAC.1
MRRSPAEGLRSSASLDSQTMLVRRLYWRRWRPRRRCGTTRTWTTWGCSRCSASSSRASWTMWRASSRKYSSCSTRTS